MWREAQNALPKPKDRMDIQAHRKFAEQRRDLRKKMDEERNEAIDALLTEEQIVICEKVEAAHQTYLEKGEAAYEEADQKLLELIGEERLQASQGMMMPPLTGAAPERPRRALNNRPPMMP